MTGADGITRTRVEAGHRRQLVTVFGQVTMTKMAYRAPGAANLHPADAALNLPEDAGGPIIQRWIPLCALSVRFLQPRYGSE